MMIPLKPRKPITPQCKSCGSINVTENQLLFQGIHVLQDCKCHNCDFEFFHTLPIGHDHYFPIQFSKDGKKTFYDPKVKDWHAEPLIRSLISKSKIDININLKIKKEYRNVIVLSCLENCYGHFLSRLFNAQSLLDRHHQFGLIVIIQEKFEWMLPEEVAEVWSVNLTLKDSESFLVGLDAFVKQQFVRFDEIFLSKSLYLNPYKFISVSRILKIDPFNLNQFSKRNPAVTFVLREDRFWHNSYFFSLLYKISIKFRLQVLLKRLFVYRQNMLVSRTAKKLYREFPDMTIYSAGLGKSGKLFKRIKDLRKNEITIDDEKEWMQIYSNSHLVIGVHGSNMIIPTSLSAGFIDILPRYKIPNMVEDTMLPYSPRLFEFLGRYLDEFSSPNLLALHAKSIIEGFEYRFQNATQKPE